MESIAMQAIAKNSHAATCTRTRMNTGMRISVDTTTTDHENAKLRAVVIIVVYQVDCHAE
ncbi:hypothetical protein Pla52o_34080 [Novipirellula galeiformis]|uniref:Uncharacterized protein n=1 Tax=Novipirellula galeiformis TaxID=2528004 RepID=A0A5C6CE30_9BACT|nr:hypothetical protein Pla52o_34080 [Novipirellula galeiformis]